MVALPLLLLALLGGPTGGSPWSTRAPLGVERQEVAVAAIGTDVYVVGGFDAAGGIRDTAERWDAAADAWSPVAPLPVVVHHAAAATVGGKLYVVGGWSDFFLTPRASLFEYDPGADAWTERAPLPAPVGSPAAVAHEGRLYVAGGFRGFASVDDFAVWDPVADTWTPLPSMTTARNHFGLAVSGGRLHAVGGRAALGSANLAAHEAYDLVAGVWTALVPLPRARSGHAVAGVGGFVLAFGGEGNPDHPDGVFPDVDAWDPATGTWLALAPLPTPRHGIGAAVLGNDVHLPGGGDVEGFGTTPVHEVYDATLELGVPVPALATWHVLLLLALIAGAGAAKYGAGDVS